MQSLTRTARTAFPTTTRLSIARTAPIRTMSSTSQFGELKIENTDIKSAIDAKLNDQQKTVVGSVLDLFAGRPSLAKLQLWSDDATFSDPLTVATGRKQYEAQWYGLQTAFSEIERLSHEVTSSGNPIEMNLSTRYVVKGIGAEKKIDSVIKIWVDGQGKIERCEDRWNNELPDGSIANAFRRLNAVSVPLMVSVPKNAEEDAKRGN